jgi:RNA polymerase sigma-54 factor
MQRLTLNQSLSQKLSPQQIQFIKLLQIPTIELQARIQEELDINPALEDTREEHFESLDTKSQKEPDSDGNDGNDDNNFEDNTGEDSNDSYDDFETLDRYDDSPRDEINVSEYLHSDETGGYKMQDGGETEDRDMPMSVGTSLLEALETQLGYLRLNEHQHAIGQQLIGSVENDGYIRRDMGAIVNDLAFLQNVETNQKEVELILKKIQKFEPSGIAARNLQECLVLQLQRKLEEEVHTPEECKLIDQAIEIIENYFEEFSKKHYIKIEKRLDISEDILKKIIHIITKLNPKPGDNGVGEARTQYIIPDFVLENTSGKLSVSLNSKNAPELKISRSFAEMLDTYDKSSKKDKSIKETVSFIKQKLDAAKWFIDAIKQRQQTLLRTMQAIANYQYDFFLEGDESKFKPMILKDIADKIGMDISTVSRVANSKTVQTEFGIFPLKYFFSEGIATEAGEDVSSREVKSKLKEFVDNEDKKKPLSDDKLERMLNDSGYLIARRTVAKYREQLGIAVARLRKEI